MIPKEYILDLINKFKREVKIPDSQPVKQIVAETEMEYYEKHPFYTLTDILNNFSLLYFSHNGQMDIGLPYSEVISFFGKGRQVIQAIGSDRAFFSDESLEVYPTHSYYEFLDQFFDLKRRTFQSNLVEPGYGLRLEKGNRLMAFLERAVQEKIPLFIHTVDFEKHKEKAFVVNGFLE